MLQIYSLSTYLTFVTDAADVQTLNHLLVRFVLLEVLHYQQQIALLVLVLFNLPVQNAIPSLPRTMSMVSSALWICRIVSSLLEWHLSACGYLSRLLAVNVFL